MWGHLLFHFISDPAGSGTIISDPDRQKVSDPAWSVFGSRSTTLMAMPCFFPLMTPLGTVWSNWQSCFSLELLLWCSSLYWKCGQQQCCGTGTAGTVSFWPKKNWNRIFALGSGSCSCCTKIIKLNLLWRDTGWQMHEAGERRNKNHCNRQEFLS
jgi:hypothetical protein